MCFRWVIEPDHVFAKAVIGAQDDEDLRNYPAPADYGEARPQNDEPVLVAIYREECERNIAKRQQVLEAEKAFIKGHPEPLLRILEQDGIRWDSLSNNDVKWNKDVILAVCQSRRCPRGLSTWDDVWYENAPAAICEDKDILMTRLALCHLWSFWNRSAFRIPQHLLGDEEVVAAAVKAYPDILLLDDENYNDIFFDKETVFLAFVQSYSPSKEHQPTFEDIKTVFSDDIRSNPELALQAFQTLRRYTVPDALAFFLDPVKENRAIVLAAVRKNVRCFKDAANSLKRDADFVRTACHQNSFLVFGDHPLQHADPAVLQELSRDITFIMSHWPSYKPPALFSSLVNVDGLMLDWDASVWALGTGFLSVSDLRPELQGDRSYWKTAIGRFHDLYYSLPNEFADDPEFAHAITRLFDERMVHTIFQRFPDLRDDESLWSVIVSSSSYFENSAEGIRTYAPIHIRNNFALMKKACQMNSEGLMAVLSPELQNNVEIIETLIEHGGVRDIPHAVQLQLDHPRLIAQLLNKYEDDQGGTTALFQNAEFVIEWLSSAKDDYSFIAEELWSNEGVVLAFAKICESFDSELFERFVPTELRGNKQFMTKVVRDCNAVLGIMATENLLHDYDFAVSTSFGSMAADDCAEVLHDGDDERIAFLRKVLAIAREKVSNQRGFSAFLKGVSGFALSDSPLSMLRGDETTTIALIVQIAVILGVPTVGELPKLHSVIENLGVLDCYCGGCRL